MAAKTETPTDSLLTPEQAATYLGLVDEESGRPQIGTLSGWRIKGEGPKYIKLGDSIRSPIRYRASELDRWLSQHEVDPSQARRRA